MKYRKKPVVIEAVQYTEYGKLVKGMCNSQSCYLSGNNEPHVHTIHDNQIVVLEVGDYIIPEPDGIHFYPCKPDIFANTYEPFDTTSPSTEELNRELREENERLKGLIEKAVTEADRRDSYEKGFEGSDVDRYAEEAWQQFKTDNSL